MISQTEILGAHVFSFRDGSAFTVPDPGGNTSRTVKPGAADPAWYDWGILDVSVAKAMKEKEIWRPAPGVKQLEDVIPYAGDITLKIKKQELSNLDMELLWGALALPNSPTAGGQFNPLEQQAVNSASPKAWIKLQYYGRGGTNLITVDLYCYLKYDGDFTVSEDPVEPTIVARMLRSPLNTGVML